MSEKPIPEPTSLTEEFWEATNEHKLVLQYCNECDTYTYYPRGVCINCMNYDLEWKEVSGEGEIYSYTITENAPEGFEDDVPYTVASVDLKEGARVLTNIVSIDPEDVEIGMSVEVTFEDINDDLALPKFEPTS